MIRVEDAGRVTEYHNISRVFDHEDYNILVTYTVDGEPAAPLYTRRGSEKRDVLSYIADQEPGTVSHIRLWRVLHEIFIPRSAESRGLDV